MASATWKRDENMIWYLIPDSLSKRFDALNFVAETSDMCSNQWYDAHQKLDNEFSKYIKVDGPCRVKC